MQITHHTQLLNYLATKHNLKSYLEIGVQNPANNFDKVMCEHKIGVDPIFFGISHSCYLVPLTSDEYFNNSDQKFDLVIIDGNHTKEQAKRDFENSLRCLNDGGFIVIHDTLPENEEGTIVPRQTKVWWGDVYKFAAKLYSYAGIDYVTINMDNGCTVVWKEPMFSIPQPLIECSNWTEYLENRVAALHIIQPSEIENYF